MSAPPAAPPPCPGEHDYAWSSASGYVTTHVGGNVDIPKNRNGGCCRRCGHRTTSSTRQKPSLDYAKTVVRFHWTR
ncbi:hypothetical protein LCGC14_1537280 [marine sediment metagenome]|uniref:Uncharacterized protein n=1 Tax=marine sediment metagenome TaxID=412755 RepID=A0A0F9JF35_9ZZZZ